MTNHDIEASGLPSVLAAAAGAWAEDLAVAAEAARAGGRAVMEWYGRDDLAIEDPTGRGPVTRADRAAQAAIARVLAERRPGEAVRSEEARDTPGAGGDAPRLWVVDPLDGTKEFIGRIPEFSVMIGLSVGGRARLGAVLQPVQDRLYLGVVGVGAWRLEAGEVVALDARGPAPERLRLVRSRSHPDARLTALESALGDTEVILSGSVGTKCARLAEGEADLYVHPVPYLREWDTCAPEAVLAGAGGAVTDCAGAPLEYGKVEPSQPGGIFAARPAARERAVPIVLRISQS